MKKKFKKLVLAFEILVAFFVVFSTPLKTKALSLCFAGIGCLNHTTDDLFVDMESRYDFNKDTWKNSKQKVDAPRVEIFFDNTNPKPGEKVTAHAVPEFFKNDTQNLYYSWYIIHTRDGRSETATNTVRSGKIEAQRLMAHGDYDPELDNQKYDNPRSDPDKDGWPAADNANEDKISAPFGGADGKGQRCYKHDFGTNANGSASDGSGSDYRINCSHKWISAPSYKSGSGIFRNGEEEYWKTDPTDPDTDGDGSSDEADVIGLNQQDFTWNYQVGDRVGVVVEGTSMIPVDENDAYFKIMWGYLDVCDSSKNKLLDDDGCEDSNNFGYGFLATKSPLEQGDDKLKVSLSFSPDTPQADPSNANSENIKDDGSITDADQIVVASSLDNTNLNPGQLYYNWQIQRGNPQDDDWGKPLNITDNFTTTSPSSGMGISQFTFTPKKDALPDNTDIVYFKVTVTVNRTSGTEQGRGRSSVIIPVNTRGLKIAFHKVDIRNGKAVIGDEVCDEGLYLSLCPVVEGQMLAAVVKSSGDRYNSAQFAWNVDGSPAYPPANASQLFDGWSNKAIFFPITKNEQETEDISVTATPADQLQPVTVSRATTVVHPALFLKSNDLSISWPKKYSALSMDERAVTNTYESQDAFEALIGNLASYYVDFLPYYLLSNDANTQIDWSVNGMDVNDPDFISQYPEFTELQIADTGQSISIPTADSEGVFYDLSATVTKYWSEDEKNISYAAWGVAPDTLTGDANISIETIEDSPTEAFLNTPESPQQMLAAIGTHLPHYFMYILRLALTIAVMFATSAGFYILSQKFSRFNEE